MSGSSRTAGAVFQAGHARPGFDETPRHGETSSVPGRDSPAHSAVVVDVHQETPEALVKRRGRSGRSLIFPAGGSSPIVGAARVGPLFGDKLRPRRALSSWAPGHRGRVALNANLWLVSASMRCRSQPESCHQVEAPSSRRRSRRPGCSVVEMASAGLPEPSFGG